MIVLAVALTVLPFVIAVLAVDAFVVTRPPNHPPSVPSRPPARPRPVR